ncbi:MAG TPA: nucleotide sugar dehydrogenase [Rhodothermales bacterium]|nr:nucleotide sugar dehydrogenase [Rhodothermales bacterium]
MRILVWGLGYVGTVSAACLAHLGHEVIGIEPTLKKVEAINAGQSALVEPGLAELIAEAVAEGRLRATQDGTPLVAESDVSLICVGTPSAADGGPVLDYVRNVAENIGTGLRDTDGYHVVALRSTVFPGTSRKVLAPLLEEHAGKIAGEDFGVVMNPEFLREASAVKDFNAPPYTVIGQLNERSGEVIAALYDGIDAPIYHVGLEEAEMLKMGNNAFHALKIGFANEVGRFCDALGMDSHTVMDLVCADTKLNISTAYLKPGFAFGGSCLPKDLRSMTYHARRKGVQMPIMDGILPSNRLQVEAARRKVHELGVRKVGVLGLSFKSGTDDLRESPVITLIRELWQDGLDVVVHDPDVNPEEMLGSNRAYLERQLPQIGQIMRPRMEEVMKDAEAVIVTQNRPAFIEAIQQHGAEVAVLDLVRLGDGRHLDGVRQYIGLSW